MKQFHFYSKKFKWGRLETNTKKGKLNIYPQTSNSGPSFSKFVATMGSCTLYDQTCAQTVNPRKPLYTLISFQCSVSSEQLSSPLPFHAISSAFSLTSCLHHTYCATLFSFHHFGDTRRTHSKWCSGLWAIFFFYFKYDFSQINRFLGKLSVYHAGHNFS